jgi:hypothetical protein
VNAGETSVKVLLPAWVGKYILVEE